MLINFSDLHSYLYHADTMEAPTYLVLQISYGFLKDYFPNLAFTRFTFMPFLYSQKLHSQELRWLIALSLTYFERKDNYGLLILGGISYLLYYIYRWTPYKILTSSEKQRENSEAKRIEEMLSLIHQNFDQRIHLEDLANEFHLTRTYVSSLIKNNLGISFQEYLNNLRFEKATQLMFDTKKSLLDISYESRIQRPKIHVPGISEENRLFSKRIPQPYASFGLRREDIPSKGERLFRIGKYKVPPSEEEGIHG